MRKFTLPIIAPLLIGAAAPSHVEYPPGVGVLCTMVFIDIAAEAGRRCYAGHDPAYQARLQSAEAKLDAYFLKNTPASPEQLAKFKREQSGIGAPVFNCKDGNITFAYNGFKKPDPSLLTTEIDKLLARPGKPTFGDCT